jgi:hypothetical protein
MWMLAFGVFSTFAQTESPKLDEIPPLRPPQGEIPPTFWEQHGLIVVVLSVLLLAIVGALIWLLTRPRRPIVIPPEAEARQALESLPKESEDGLVVSQVSQILRHYILTAFGLPPDEMTTTEFCRAIASHDRPGPELTASITEFLRRCDERKFARTASLPPLGAVPQAFKFIELTEARLAQLRQAAALSQENRPPKPALGRSAG